MMAQDGVRLNLGRGEYKLKGYVNLDAKDGHEIYPLRDAYLLREDGVERAVSIVEGCDEIRASHILEHFRREDVPKVLADWFGRLKPGGALKIAVPDFKRIADDYEAGGALDRGDIEGYVMGGQSDERDYHRSLFDESGLRRDMERAGLVDIARWQSEVADCASLAISLNLRGIKPNGDISNRVKTEIKVAAIMSVPRLCITSNVACMFRAIAECGIPCRPAQGVFWHHAITRQIEDRMAEGFDYLLAVDFDSWFLPGHVTRLTELMLATPGADAICAVQCEREGSLPIMGIRDCGGNPMRSIPRHRFAGPLTPIDIGHFGLTMFRASAFKDLPKPWFRDQPDANGSWREGRRDADVAFWDHFKRHGRKLYMANEVNIGHLQEICTFPGLPDDNWRPVHVHLRDLNAGNFPAHCNANYRKENNYGSGTNGQN